MSETEQVRDLAAARREREDREFLAYWNAVADLPFSMAPVFLIGSYLFAGCVVALQALPLWPSTIPGSLIAFLLTGITVATLPLTLLFLSLWRNQRQRSGLGGARP